MACHAAYRLLDMNENLARIVAIELLTGAQGIDFRSPVLTSEPPRRPYWFWTVRPNEREVTRTVNSVLDDLDRIKAGAPKAGAPDPKRFFDPNPTRTT